MSISLRIVEAEFTAEQAYLVLDLHDDSLPPSARSKRRRSVMDRFEYLALSWAAPPDSIYSIDELNRLGADGWEAVGMTSRITALPMPGMGAGTASDVTVLLKRRLPTQQ